MTHSAKLTEQLKKYLTQYFKKLGVKNPEIHFEKPALIEHGDLACDAALKYAKELKKNPAEIANGAIEFLKKKEIECVEEIKFAPPGYINFYFDNEYTKNVLEDIIALSDDYGKNKLLKGEKWVIEHTSPNPNKAMHLGHLRNNLIGMSIANLLESCGAKVVCDAVDNNRGIAIAKMMWGFLSQMKKNANVPTDIAYWSTHKNEWETPADLGLLPDIFVTKCYILGENDFKSDESVEDKVRDLVVKWEANDKLTRELWSHVLDYSYEGINRTLQRIGNRWDKVWHEHEHYQDGKDYVMKGLKKGIFIQLEDGAVLTKLEKYNLTDTILLKKDGTSLYITQDIALTAMKKKKYKADKLVWVIGPEQSMAMKQMFAVCEQMGIGKYSDFTHIPYGYVGLKTDEGFKKMSSREGTVVLIDDIIDTAKKTIQEKSVRENNADDAEVLYEKLALAAVKFSMLKVDRMQEISFDIEKSVDVQGDTGIYLLYTYARINSILRKAAGGKAKVEPQAIKSADVLVKKMAMFESSLERSLESYSIHHVSQFLLQVAAEFNSWYNKEIILDNSEAQPHKLAVAKSVAQVLKNGLKLLGIEVVEKM